MKNIDELYSKAFKKLEAEEYDELLKFIEEMKRVDPTFKRTYLMEAVIALKSNEFCKAIDILEKLLPRYDLSLPKEKEEASIALRILASSYAQRSAPEEALKFFKLSAQMTIDDNEGFIRYCEALLMANCLENFSDKDFRVLYDGLKKYLAHIVPYPKKFYNHEKIRVGFLSGNFGNHSMINWASSLLSGLDKKTFDTYCYSSINKEEFVTKIIHSSVDVWRDIHTLTNKDAAKLIHDDEIDILFDLDGHTLNNCLQVAVYHPATVQISGVGYMNSTGLDCFDYFLSDVYCAGDEKFFTEKVIRLPHSHICYEPVKVLELTETPPCLKNNFVTFGSFNSSIKITDSILATWKKILDIVPSSHLLLKHKLFSKDDGKNFFAERLNNFGFDLSRVELRPFSANHLAEYADVDIALDTFPYTGGVTTCEALYMGVPVVSIYGARHGTRFGLSILKNIGLDDLAVDSYEKYIIRAFALASDWDLLTLLRKNLRTMMEKSPLMNSELYIRDVEQAFIKILDDERGKL